MFKLSLCLVSNLIAADLAILSYCMLENWSTGWGEMTLLHQILSAKYTGEYSIGGCRLQHFTGWDDLEN
jgi:hypothetical protein